jgi:acyl carrier protein
VSFLSDFLKGSAKENAATTSPSDAKPGGSPPASSSVEREAIIAALRGHLETVWRAANKPFNLADFDQSADLYEKGYVDSLSAAQFLLLAEKQYGITLPDWLLGGRAKSLVDLADHISGELSRRR